MKRLRQRGAQGWFWSSGEAGIGKTRLAAEEVARRALDHGSTVLYGRCDEGSGRAVPAVRRGPDASRPAPARILSCSVVTPASWYVSCPKMASVDPGPAASAAGRSRDRALQSLRRGGCHGSDLSLPTASAMLVIDDLHWSEQSTILLIPAPGSFRRTDAATDRGDLPGHGTARRTMPLTNFLADLGTLTLVWIECRLEGLDLPDVSDMVNGVGGHGPVTRRLGSWASCCGRKQPAIRCSYRRSSAVWWRAVFFASDSGSADNESSRSPAIRHS